MDYSDLDAVTWPYQLTEVVHRDLYSILDPKQPQLSAKGKTVLITGVSGGVGQASRCILIYVSGKRRDWYTTN